MPTRLPALRWPPIGFAHRGAKAHAPENTIEAFHLALRLGASGLESDVWLTRDGVAVLDHDGVIGLRRRSISTLDRADLPAHIPALAELYDTCGSDYELSLDVKDVEAAPEVLAVARTFGPHAASRLWLCHHEAGVLASWREPMPEVKLVHSTFLRRMRTGPERHAAELRAAGIDVVNLHHSEWTGGLTTLFHRFEVLAFGWDAQHDRILDELLDIGIDAVYSDHVDKLTAALGRIA